MTEVSTETKDITHLKNGFFFHIINTMIQDVKSAPWICKLALINLVDNKCLIDGV